jgi:hypothetical protein
MEMWLNLGEYFLLLKKEIRTILTEMDAVNLLMFHLPSESIATDGFSLINKTIFTALFRTDVSIHFILKEFPTECCRALVIHQGFQVNASFLRFWKGDVVTLQKQS